MGTEEEKETFVLHESLLRQSSAFFDKALNGAWKEAQIGTVKLPETGIQTFAVFAKFLLTGWLFIQKEDEVLPTGGSIQRGSAHEVSIRNALTFIVCLLELAHFLQAPDFQDAAVDAFIETLHEFREGKRVVSFAGVSVARIYEHSMLKSPVRKLIVDICLHAWIDKTAYKNRNFESYPHRFCHDFMKAAAQYITSENDANRAQDPLDISKSCKYHEHTCSKQPCYKEKFQFLMKKPEVTQGKLTW